MAIENATVTNNGTGINLPVITLANVFGDLTSILIIITIMAGITTRTLWKYGAKLQSGEISFFDRKFLYTAVLAFGTSLLPGLALFAPLADEFVKLYSTYGLGIALVAVFFMSMGINDAWNSGAKSVVTRIEKAQLKRLHSQIDKQMMDSSTTNQEEAKK